MQPDILVNLGQKIRDRRREIGVSQEEFAELVGVHRTYVGMIERGEKNITLLNVEKFAKALNLSISELLKSE